MNARVDEKVLTSPIVVWESAALSSAEDVVGLVAESDPQLATKARPAMTAERKRKDEFRMAIGPIKSCASSRDLRREFL